MSTLVRLLEVEKMQVGKHLGLRGFNSFSQPSSTRRLGIRTLIDTWEWDWESMVLRQTVSMGTPTGILHHMAVTVHINVPYRFPSVPSNLLEAVGENGAI
jgi:hypothetical protein